MEYTEASDAVRQALEGLSLEGGKKACCFRIAADSFGAYFAEAVLIIDQETWDSVATEACRQFTRDATIVFADVPVMVLIVCRTRIEHEAALVRETDLWTYVQPHGVSC
jgi:hypothetical protein